MTFTATQAVTFAERARLRDDRIKRMEARRKAMATMRERYGASHVGPETLRLKMHLTDWFPDPDVPGVRMRILRGI